MGRKVKKVKKKKKILSIPCLLAMAVPSFVLALVENEMLTVKNEETWEAAFCIIGLIVIVYSILQCGLRGIWIGPLRFFLGASIGILGAVGLILILGFLLVIGAGGGSSDVSYRVHRDGEQINIYPMDSDSGSNQRYRGDDGEIYIMKNSVRGYVYDRYGRAYSIT